MDHFFVIDGFDIRELNEIFVQRHSRELLPVEQKDYRDVQLDHIEIDTAFFSQPDERSAVAQTRIVQRDGSLFVSCSCASAEEKLCGHESRALHLISKRRELRIFFDPAIRNERLREYRSEEHTSELQSLMRISY